MGRRDKVGTRGKLARIPYSEGWKPPARQYPPLPTVDSPLEDKVAAVVLYIGPYLVPGQADEAARKKYGVPYARFVQAVIPLAYDEAVIEAKPRETRRMREQMSKRRDARARARTLTAPHPLRHVRNPSDR